MSDKKKTVHDFEFIGRLLELLKILWEETDEFTSITQQEILKLMEEHGHPCSARTLTDYLRMIMRELNPEEADGSVKPGACLRDYRIVPKGLEEKLRARELGLFPDGARKLQLRSLRYNHPFSFEELDQLVEAVLFLKTLDDTQKEELIRRIAGMSSRKYPLVSPYFGGTTKAPVRQMAGVYEDVGAKAETVKENLCILQKAMGVTGERPVKVAFTFNGYDAKQELVPRRSEQGEKIRYVVDPYYIILSQGRYYLICSKEPGCEVSVYRIDLMTDLTDRTGISPIDREKRISRPRRQKSEIRGLPAEWNSRTASKFHAEHLYLFYGDPQTIHLRIDRERYTLLHDYFGTHYRFLRQLDETHDEVAVSCVPEAMRCWAMQCGSHVEVLRPEWLRERIRKACLELAERYQRKNEDGR